MSHMHAAMSYQYGGQPPPEPGILQQMPVPSAYPQPGLPSMQPMGRQVPIEIRANALFVPESGLSQTQYNRQLMQVNQEAEPSEPLNASAIPEVKQPPLGQMMEQPAQGLPHHSARHPTGGIGSPLPE